MERRKPLNGKQVASAGYDDQTQTLEIEFENGWVYVVACPRELYEEMMAAASPGAYYSARIKPYGARRIR